MEHCLKLAIEDYQDIRHFRWILADGQSNEVARHDVALDPDAMEYAGYLDLPQFLNTYRHAYKPVDLLRQVGRWMGENVFGPLRPVIREKVRRLPFVAASVRLPQNAAELLQRPLEVAQLKDKSLVESGVRLIYQRESEVEPMPKPVGRELRVLSVFSLPTSASPLNLRRERFGLKRLFESISRRLGVAIDLRTIQYGATRQTLEDALDEGEGWDIIHFSGHGQAGFLVLEKDDGEKDMIPAEEIALMLRPTKARLKLLTLSACLSGASHGQARHWLDSSRDVSSSETSTSPQVLNVGYRLAEDLECAVLAMRFTVTDSFAIRLSQSLYPLLFEKKQSLPQALYRASTNALTAEIQARAPLSLFTPVLFGEHAAALTVSPPAKPKPPNFDLKTTGLFNFPREPERFIGRLLPMLRATGALAPRGQMSGVLFYGMAGAGKTTCALELAYRHERTRFAGYVFYRCPPEDHYHPSAIGDFLHSMENQLSIDRGTLTALWKHPDDFRERLLPRLVDMLRRESILIVLDNAEGLLDRNNEWRDPKWGALVDAVLAHSADSRVVITSRRVPRLLETDDRLLREPFHALSLSESVLLAAEMKNLSKLFRTQKGRALLSQTLMVIQGHPTLLEMADTLAAHQERLKRQVEQALAIAVEGDIPLHTFFDDGESQQPEQKFREALSSWTEGVTAMLTPGASLLFSLLCRIEEGDRQDRILGAIWPVFLDCLRSLDDGAERKKTSDPELERVLNELVASGLVDRGEEIAEAEDGERNVAAVYRIHPAVAAAQLSHVDAIVRNAVDVVLGDYFWVHMLRGLKAETDGSGMLVVRAARRAMPYLLRRKKWDLAMACLETVVNRDRTPSARDWAIPIARMLLEKMHGSESEVRILSILGNVLRSAGCYPEATTILSEALARTESDKDYAKSSYLAGPLIYALMQSGKLAEALQVADKKIEWTRLAGFGPWSQLCDKVERLQVLNALGRYEEVHNAVADWRNQLNALPQERYRDEAEPWKVRETLLHTGLVAAASLGYWESALDFNQARILFERERGALEVELSRMAFDSHRPLLCLGYREQAKELLRKCREDFDKERDYEWLAKACSALAQVESEDGRSEAALRLEQAAIKYRYVICQPGECTISHNNLSLYLGYRGGCDDEALAHILAAAIINYQIGSAGFAMNLRNLRRFASRSDRPSFEEVGSTVEKTEGVRFRELLEQLPRRAATGDAALAAVWQMVKDQETQINAACELLPPQVRSAFRAGKSRDAMNALRAALLSMDLKRRREVTQRLDEVGLMKVKGPPSITARTLRAFEPLLQAVANVARGDVDEGVQREIEVEIQARERRGWWFNDEARRIWDGERDPKRLTVGLDSNSAFLATRILEFIVGPKKGGFNRDKNVGAIWTSLPLQVRLAFRGTGVEAQLDVAAATDGLPPEAQQEVQLKLCELGLLGPVDLANETHDLTQLAQDVACVAKGEGDAQLRKACEYALLFLENGGWQLAEPVRQLWAGERSLEALTAGLDTRSRRFVVTLLYIILSTQTGEDKV